MITPVTGYQTDDGEFFPTYEDAQEHAVNKAQLAELEKFCEQNMIASGDEHAISSMYAMLPRDFPIYFHALRRELDDIYQTMQKRPGGATTPTMSAWDLVKLIVTKCK